MNKIVAVMLAIAALLLGYGLSRSGFKADAGLPADAAASVMPPSPPSDAHAPAESRADLLRTRTTLRPSDAAWVDALFDTDDGKRYPLRSLQTEFTALQAKMAAGDLLAAQTLANALSQCSEAGLDVAYSPDSWAYYQSQLESQRAAGTLSEARYRARLAKIWYSYQICGNVTAEQRQLRRVALQRLAEAGDHQALYAFSFLGWPKDPNLPLRAQVEQGQAYAQTVEHLLQQAMARADPDAFATMAAHYSQTIVIGQSRLYGVDPVKNIAYTLAERTLRQRRLADTARTDIDRAAEAEQLKTIDQYLLMFRPDGPGRLEKLTAEQLAAAEASAKELLLACCG